MRLFMYIETRKLIAAGAAVLLLIAAIIALNVTRCGNPAKADSGDVYSRIAEALGKPGTETSITIKTAEGSGGYGKPLYSYELAVVSLTEELVSAITGSVISWSPADFSHDAQITYVNGGTQRLTVNLRASGGQEDPEYLPLLDIIFDKDADTMTMDAGVLKDIIITLAARQAASESELALSEIGKYLVTPYVHYIDYISADSEELGYFNGMESVGIAYAGEIIINAISRLIGEIPGQDITVENNRVPDTVSGTAPEIENAFTQSVSRFLLNTGLTEMLELTPEEWLSVNFDGIKWLIYMDEELHMQVLEAGYLFFVPLMEEAVHDIHALVAGYIAGIGENGAQDEGSGRLLAVAAGQCGCETSEYSREEANGIIENNALLSGWYADATREVMTGRVTELLAANRITPLYAAAMLLFINNGYMDDYSAAHFIITMHGLEYVDGIQFIDKD